MGEPSRTRNEHGQYDDRIPPERVLDVFHARDDRGRPLTANDVMDALNCSRRTAHNKLNELTERGTLETRKVGAHSRVWWIPLGPASGADSRASAQSSAVSSAIASADLPGSGPTLEARREALSAAYDYLSDHPEAKKADFIRDVYNEFPAGYESAEGWWNAIQPALKRLPGVDPPEERGHIWHFLGG